MNLRLLPVVFILLNSCQKTEINVKPQSSCVLEKTTTENGSKVSEIKYDAQKRPINVEYTVKDLNISICYDDAKNIKYIKSKLYGQIEILYNADKQIIAVNSSYGELSFTYSGKNISKISHQYPDTYTSIINGTAKNTDYRFEYIGENVSKVFMTNGSKIKDLLVFEGSQYDDKSNIYPKEMSEYFMITTILNYFVSNYDLDFSAISNNNIIAKRYFRPTLGEFISFKYDYIYNSEGYPIQIQYTTNNGSLIKYNYLYICK